MVRIANNKKGQIFLMDMIFSIVILIVAIGLIFTYFSTTQDNSNIYELSTQLMNGYTRTELNSLNNKEVRNLFQEGEIRNVHNTVAQQVAEFHYRGKNELSRNLTRDFAQSYVGENFNYNFTLVNTTSGNEFRLFTKVSRNEEVEDSDIVSELRRPVVGFINKTEHYEYKLKIKIWK